MEGGAGGPVKTVRVDPRSSDMRPEDLLRSNSEMLVAEPGRAASDHVDFGLVPAREPLLSVSLRIEFAPSWRRHTCSELMRSQADKAVITLLCFLGAADGSAASAGASRAVGDTEGRRRGSRRAHDAGTEGGLRRDGVPVASSWDAAFAKTNRAATPAANDPRSAWDQMMRR
jgi:hypothetical protein